MVAKSYPKVVIGKTYWKSIALPAILYGKNLSDFTKEELMKLQRVENRAYRQIIGAQVIHKKQH